MSELDVRDLLRPQDFDQPLPSEIDSLIARGLRRRHRRRGLQASVAVAIAVIGIAVAATLINPASVPDIAETPDVPQTTTSPNDEPSTTQPPRLPLVSALPQIASMAPFDAITTGHGSVWLATGATSPDTAQVVRISSDGQSILATLQMPAGVLAATTDALWAGFVGGHGLDAPNTVTRIDPTTNTFGAPIGLGDVDPSFLAADGEVLWVATGHPSSGRILRIGPAGDVTGPWTLDGLGQDGVTGFVVRDAIAYVVTMRGKVASYELTQATPANTTLTPSRQGTLTTDDESIFTSAAVGPDGTLWVARQGSAHPLYAWGPDGIVRSYGSGGGHAVEVAGDIPVVIGANAAVRALTEDGLVALIEVDDVDVIQRIAGDGTRLWISAANGLGYADL